VTDKAWSRVRVADLVLSGEAEVKTGPFGTQLHARDYVESGTPVINVRNIGFGGIRADKLEYIADETVERLSGHLLQTGDIVFGRKGAVERHVLIRKGQSRWFQGSDCLRLRLKTSRILPHFLSYHLLTHDHQQWMMQQCSHGATMASLNQDIVGRIEFLAPDPGHQAVITSILSAYDDLIENNTRRIAILEDMARRIYDEWFIRFRFPGHEGVRMIESESGLVPEVWKIGSVANVAIVHRGRSYKGSELAETGGRPFVNLKCMERDGGFRASGLKRYTGDFKESQTVRPGDMVMGITDMTQERRIVARVGRVTRLDMDFGVFSMDLVRIASRGEYPEPYIYAMFRWSGFADEVKQHANGANVLHLLPARIEEYQFAQPTSDLAVRFADQVAPMFSLCDTLEQKNANLGATRDLLLPKLISGELDVSAVPEPEAVAA
jgi:type I restriction enzyme S subunit